jgi:hypothetical protein
MCASENQGLAQKSIEILPLPGWIATFLDVHDVFHVSQLKRCFKDPVHGVDHTTIDL